MKKRYTAAVPWFLVHSFENAFKIKLKEGVTYADLFDLVYSTDGNNIEIRTLSNGTYMFAMTYLGCSTVSESVERWEDAASDAIKGAISIHKRNERCFLDQKKECNDCNVSAIFNGESVLITDPCYFIKGEDWKCMCDIMANNAEVQEFLLNKLGINGFSVGTKYGDWVCDLYKVKLNEALPYLLKRDYSSFYSSFEESEGRFCADSGCVCVVSLNDAKKYNESLVQKVVEDGKIGAIVKDFSGVAKFLDVKGKTNAWTCRHIILEPKSEDAPGYVSIQRRGL